MLVLFAQETTTTSQSPASFLILPLLIGLFYLFMIRPQRQRVRHHQEMVRAIEIGDEIETVAGMYGSVERMSDDVLWIEVAPGVTLKMSRAAVRRRVSEEPAPDGSGEA